MKLVSPTPQYEASWKRAIQEFEDEGRIGFWNYYKKPSDLETYIELTRSREAGEDLPEGRVPNTTFWLIDGEGEDERFVGHCNIRHKLNDYLEKIGGHIGYAIPPSERNKGYGTKILELALIEARKLGIEKALVTCDESNAASKKIIERNGGIYENSVTPEEGDRENKEPKMRFWITTTTQEQYGDKHVTTKHYT